MLAYSEWKAAEEKGIVHYVTEPYLRLGKWHVLVFKRPMDCAEFELEDEREGISVYLRDMRLQSIKEVEERYNKIMFEQIPS